MSDVELTKLNTELLARKSVSPIRETADGKKDAVWSTLDSALITVPYLQALVMDGRVFHARVGSSSTAITLDADWANTDPDISLDVPAGTTVIPLVVRVVLDAFGTDDLCEIITLCSSTLAAASAGTKFTSVNYRLRHTRGSACSVYVGPTVTNSYAGNYFELSRDTYMHVQTMSAGEAGPPNTFLWTYKKDGAVPLLEGNASMATWAVSEAASGYIHYVWAEIPSLPYA